jgi:hypothetical protein
MLAKRVIGVFIFFSGVSIFTVLARGSKCRYGVFARLPPGFHSVLLCLEVTVDAHRHSVEQEQFECVAKVGMKAPLPVTFVLGYLMLRDECLGDAASACS